MHWEMLLYTSVSTYLSIKTVIQSATLFLGHNITLLMWKADDSVQTDSGNAVLVSCSGIATILLPKYA
jgi:hypothetical protein